MIIETLDLTFQGLPQTIAAYLVHGPAGYVLVETGPRTTLPNLLTALAARGLTSSDIRHVLVTHIHLDHAGCAGWWAQQGAQVYVHHVGAPHLIDPRRLLTSAARIYGDQMDVLWGEVVPAPAGQVTSVYDGDQINAGGLTFTALDTPGHAWHHHTYRLGDVAFTGDAAGVCLPDSNWLSVPAPPPEFKLDVWQKTLARLQAEAFDTLYLTHFGPVHNPRRHLEDLRQALLATTDFIHRAMLAGASRDEILAQYLTWNRQIASAHHVSEAEFQEYEAANPLFMSVDGMMRYWQKQMAA